MNNLDLNPRDANLGGPTANDSTAPEGLVFHYPIFELFNFSSTPA